MEKKLEKVVTTERFEYYVDRLSKNNGGNDRLLMSDLNYEGSEDEETELSHEVFGCTQETSLRDVPLMAPELSSLAVGGEVHSREIESIHTIVGECIAGDRIRANLIEAIDNVIEEIPCIVEKQDCVTSTDEEEFSRNEKKLKEK